MTRTLRTALLTGIAAIALLGCEKKAEAETPPAKTATKKAAEKGAKPAPKAAPKAAEAPAKEPEAKNFAVRVLPAEAVAGQPATSVVEVTPKAGYKMNLEFPSKMRLTKNELVTAPKLEFSGADAEVTEQALKFKVAYTATAAGKVDLAGSCDFSVCNENACKLIRGEEIAWAVNVK